MDFNEALAADTVKVGRPCSIGQILATVDTKQRAQIETALADRMIAAAKIARGLVAAGLIVKCDGAAVVKHRTGVCACV